MKSIQRLRLTIARFATRGYINLRSSMVDLTDLPPGSRSVALMGIGLLLAMAIVATMLYILHKAGTLSNEVAPLTFFLASLALGWSYALTGALHARRVVRVGTLFVYIVITWYLLKYVLLVNNTTPTGLLGIVSSFFSGALLAAAPVLFVLRRRALSTVVPVNFCKLVSR